MNAETISKKVTLSMVLIVEDDYASRELLQDTLEDKNRLYISVEDGLSAIKTIKDNPDINLVFMDIRLPKMDGVEAMKKIKSLNKNIIVIAQTAYLYSLEQDRTNYLNQGFDGFIEKPFNLVVLNEIIERYI